MKKREWICVTIFLSTFCIFGQFGVDDTTYSIEELVSDILINSNCAETSNYASFTGTSQNINGIAYFNAGATDFPYQEGIVLSTGRASDARGPNIGINDSGEEDWPGDMELRVITNAVTLFNATFIQFDFIPQTNYISFNFLFASEEYQENYQCLYSDVFAFILTDSQGMSTNLAIIPDSGQPVTATTIRPGIPGECGARNSGFFDEINDRNSPISFHGQTKSLKAESVVNPGEVYTIKLVISDSRDSQVDSAVFLEAGSFALGVDLGENRTVKNGNPACKGETIPLDVAVTGVLDYRWYRDDEEITQWAGSPKVSLTEGGEYRVDLIFSATCVSSGSLVTEFVDPPEVMELPVDLFACDIDGNGKENFDFSENGIRALGNQDRSIYKVTYYSSEADAQVQENPIVNWGNYVAGRSETIYVRVSSGKSCYEIASFQLLIQDLDLQSALEEQYILCLDSKDETLDPLPILNTGLSASNYAFEWYFEEISPENKIDGASGPFLTVSSPGTYHIVLQNLDFGCQFSITTEVNISQQPSIFEVDFITDIFTDSNVIEIVHEGSSSYLFSIDNGVFGSSNRFENVPAGEHIAYMTDVKGCSVVSKEFLVVDYPRFFTPNGDGVNDLWNIVGFPEIESSEVSIFDKYGTLQYRFDGGAGWDGTTDRGQSPSSDYWFKISFVKDGLKKEFKSHFTLKR